MRRRGGIFVGVSGVTSTVVGLGIAAVLTVLLFGAAFWFIIPIVFVVLLVVLAGPVLRFVAERGAPGTDEPDVPSTREASHEPVEPRHPTEQ